MKLLLGALVLAVMGLIFFLSSLPGNVIRLPDIFSIDKFLHAGIYSLLAAAALFAVPSDRYLRHPVLISLAVVLLCFLYGISDECHQSFVPSRQPSGLDLAADAAGATAAALVRLTAERRRKVRAYYRDIACPLLGARNLLEICRKSRYIVSVQ